MREVVERDEYRTAARRLVGAIADERFGVDPVAEIERAAVEASPTVG